MINRREVSNSGDRRGFTLIELIISMVIGLIVLSAVYQLMITQSGGYGKQRELADVRETARSATTLLSWDLRHAGAGGSVLSAMSPSSVTLRSMRGVGVVCAKHPTLPRYGLWRTVGKIEVAPDDSALVFQIGRDKWSRARVTNVGTPVAMGIASCAWPGTPDLVIEVAVNSKSDTIGIKVGAPIRTFTRVEYAQYQQNSRWWLGRRVGASPEYEQLTGPLLESGGLSFSYYDSLGASTATPGLVRTVAFTIRPESFKKARLNSGIYEYQRDSLTTKVLLRR